MNRLRRSVLKSVGIAALTSISGCILLKPFSPKSPATKSSRITVSHTRCVKNKSRERNSIIVGYDKSNDEVRFQGTMKAASPCSDLCLLTYKGVGREEYSDDSVHISVDWSHKGDCVACPAEIDYAAAVQFDRNPSTIYIYHIEEIDGEWKRIGPIARQKSRRAFHGISELESTEDS